MSSAKLTDLLVRCDALAAAQKALHAAFDVKHKVRPRVVPQQP